MARPKSPHPKRFTGVQLNRDVHEELSWLATDLGVSISALLRWGGLMVLTRCNDGQAPASVAHLVERPFGGEKHDPLFDRFKRIEITLDRDLLAQIDKLAAQRGLTAHELLHQVVTTNVLGDLN